MNYASLADELPYFITADYDKGVILNKDSSLLRSCVVVPHDLSFATENSVSDVIQMINNTFSLLQDASGWGFYVDNLHYYQDSFDFNNAIKMHPVAKEFCKQRLENMSKLMVNQMVVTFYKDPQIKEPTLLDKLLFSKKENSIHDLKSDIHDFIMKTDEIIALLKQPFKNIAEMNANDILTFIYCSIYPKQQRVLAPHGGMYLDYFLSDGCFKFSQPCTINDHTIITLSIRDFPSSTRVEFMNDLLNSHHEFRVSTRYLIMTKNQARAYLERNRRQQAAKEQSLIQVAVKMATGEDSPYENNEVASMVNGVSNALAELGENISVFGKLSTVIVIKNKNPKEAMNIAIDLKKTINNHGFVVKIEGFATPDVFLGTLIGNVKRNPIKPIVSSVNFTHLMRVSSPWVGSYTNNHIAKVTGDVFPHMTVSSFNSYFNLNLNVNDVGHTLIIGPTGAGKSVLLNTLAIEWFKYNNSFVISFDKDRSCESACKAIGGQFYELGNDDNIVALNPFYDIEDIDHRSWLASYLVAYFESKNITVDATDENTIYTALTSLSTSTSNKAAWGFELFASLLHVDKLKEAMRPFINGQYSGLFQTGDDKLNSNTSWLAFEMNELLAKPKEVSQFILGYLFQKTNKFFNGRPTLLLIDEAWLFLDNAFFTKMLKDWLKTLRKKNVYVVLATQELADSKQSAIFPTIVGACQTKIFLPNKMANHDENSNLYKGMGLTDIDIATLIELTAQQDYMYYSPLGKQVFQLNLTTENIELLKPIIKQ